MFIIAVYTNLFTGSSPRKLIHGKRRNDSLQPDFMCAGRINNIGGRLSDNAFQ
jgi:hypothetical protein